MEKKLIGDNKNYLSPVNDPFNKKSLETMRISIRKKTFDEGYYITGYVEFKNGNTQAEQKFEANTFDDCVQQVKAFIESLPN